MERYIIQFRIKGEDRWCDAAPEYPDPGDAEIDAKEMARVTGDETRVIKETVIRELPNGILVD